MLYGIDWNAFILSGLALSTFYYSSSLVVHAALTSNVTALQCFFHSYCIIRYDIVSRYRSELPMNSSTHCRHARRSSTAINWVSFQQKRTCDWRARIVYNYSRYGTQKVSVDHDSHTHQYVRTIVGWAMINRSYASNLYMRYNEWLSIHGFCYTAFTASSYINCQGNMWNWSQ